MGAQVSTTVLSECDFRDNVFVVIEVQPMSNISEINFTNKINVVGVFLHELDAKKFIQNRENMYINSTKILRP
jgi:hypothetical protein